MSSGAALCRTRLLSGTVGTVAACAAALLLAPAAIAAPYPPGQPCVVTAALAAQRANVPRPGVVDVDVHGAGLEPGDAVSLTGADGRTLARVRADTQGGFATVLSAPARSDGATPELTAVTARERCVANPPGASPGDGGDPAPGDTDPTTGRTDGAGTGDGPDQGSGSNGADGPNGSNSAGTPGGGVSTAPSSDPLSTDIAGQPTSSANPASPGSGGPTTATSGGDTSTAVPPQADVPRGSGPSLGIGLAIAAALLVLGTLAVLLLTRRPEH